MGHELDALRRRFDGHEPGLLGARHSYAVLCPLVEQSNGLHLLFEVRAADIRQGGEVCFPGGRMEPGESPTACALRETEEELAIPRQEVTLLGTPDFICNQRSFLLHPVLGLISPTGISAMTPAPSEVAEVFTVPLSFFRTVPPQLYSYQLHPQVSSDFPYETLGISPSYPFQTGMVEIPVWQYEQHVIWGMTARLIRGLLTE